MQQKGRLAWGLGSTRPVKGVRCASRGHVCEEVETGGVPWIKGLSVLVQDGPRGAGGGVAEGRKSRKVKVEASVSLKKEATIE